MNELTLPELFVTPQETLLDRHGYVEERLHLEVPAVAPLCDLLPGLRPRRVEVRGVELFVEEEGEGMPVVLLHGGPGASHHSFHPSFSRLAGSARVIYYDQRGCWRSDYAPGDGYSVGQAVDDLEALRLALGVERWVVLGHSYGGFLAQCYAAAHPQAVAGLVLVCAVLPDYQDAVALQPSAFPTFLSPDEQAMQDRIFAMTELTPAQLMFNLQVNGRWKRQNYYRPTRDTLVRIARYEWAHDEGYYDSIVNDMFPRDLRGVFTQLALPTLIVEGRWDLVWNAADKPEALHRHHPHARLELFDASGHAPFHDEPERFFRLLRAFLADR